MTLRILKKRPYRRPKGGSYMPPTAGMLYRDCSERLDTLKINKREDARMRRRMAIAVQPVETVQLMADDANAKVRRVRVMDPVERAFRNNLLSDEHYRIARCLERDWLALQPPAGGLKLERLRDCGVARRDGGEHFVLLPRAPGMSTRAPQARRDDALDRLHRAEAALPDGSPAFAVLRAWAGEGRSLYELDAQWRRRRGWARMMAQLALEILADAKIYETEKWKIHVLAAA